MTSAPIIKTIALHAASVIAGAVAMGGFAASNSIDIYAAYNQLNTVVAEISKLIAMLTPIATLGYAAYRSTFKFRTAELAEDPAIKGIVTAPAIAASIPSEKVVSTPAEIPKA